MTCRCDEGNCEHSSEAIPPSSLAYLVDLFLNCSVHSPPHQRSPRLNRFKCDSPCRNQPIDVNRMLLPISNKKKSLSARAKMSTC